MASLIQLKQIESSSALIAAAAVGTNFSESVANAIADLLPSGLISSSTQLTASFDERYILSGSITQTTWDNIVGKPTGLISSSTQLDGSTLKNITITTKDADSYSLIVSGAIGVVDATNLVGGSDADNDTSVPAQIFLTGQPLPVDPSISGSGEANIIDQGEW